MAIRRERLVVLSKLEPVYGQDAVPDPAVDAIQLLNEELELIPLDPTYVQRSIVRHCFGAYQQLVGSKWVKIKLAFEGTGFGSLGPAAPIPAVDALLRSLGLLRAIAPGVKVDYTPNSDILPSTTLKWYEDVVLHTAVGLVAEKGTFSWAVNQRPKIALELIGLYTRPSDALLPAPDTSAYPKPVIVDGANTGAFTLHGYPACMQSLQVTIANKAAKRHLVNCTQQVRITGREITGQVNFEAPTLAEKDYWTPIEDGALGALSLTHGPAGNRQVFSGTNVQMTNPRFETVDGMRHMIADLIFVPGNAGNDESVYSVQ